LPLRPFVITLASSIVLSAAAAQQVTRTPGSPGATTTVQGDQLPPPPQNLRGVIGETAQQSKPYWPARIVPPKGASIVGALVGRGLHSVIRAFHAT
jgi:arylsulfatase